MEKERNNKRERLDRIVCVRMTDEDYRILSLIGERKRSNVSRVIRTIIGPVVNIVLENNIKDNLT